MERKRELISKPRHFNILVLEDDLHDYRLVTKRLQNQHHRFSTIWVKTIREALTRLKHDSFDAILSDLSVPDSHGFDTVQTLRAHCGSRVPIIVLTSLEDEHVEEEVIAAGGQDYLVKSDIRGNNVARAIVHSIQRQESFNRSRRLVRKLKRSHLKLKEQSTQLRRKNRRLKQLYRTSNEIVDNVSHDLRTPLTVIKDYVSIVASGMAGDVNDEQKKLLNKVALRADDLNHMVDDILDASKLESGLLGAWRRPVSVTEIITHAVSLLKQRAAIKGVSLVVDLPRDLPEVYCDQEKAVRVITNLAVNAIKFTPAGNNVTIWAKSAPIEAEVVLGITDHGPGIEDESLGQIFERFQQLEDGVRSTVRGFGLGLNIAQRLTRINLGKLNVESTVGKGSTFSFTIPIAEPTEVFWRWLERKQDSELPIQAVRIALDDTIEEHAANDFDRFANCLLRHDDILFRINQRQWLLLLPIFVKDLAAWKKRAERDFQRFNRNRPSGVVPCFRHEVIREWHPPMSPRKVLTSFDELLQEAFTETPSDTLVVI